MYAKVFCCHNNLKKKQTAWPPLFSKTKTFTWHLVFSIWFSVTRRSNEKNICVFKNNLLACGGLNRNFPIGACPYLMPWNDANFKPLFVLIHDPVKQIESKQTFGCDWLSEFAGKRLRKSRTNMFCLCFQFDWLPN